MRLRDIFKEQEQPATITLLVYYNEDGEEVVQPIDNFPVSIYNKQDFNQWVRRWFAAKFPGKRFVRVAVEGDTDSQGNPVTGYTPDTEVPPVLTSKDNEEVPPVEQKPDEEDAPKELPPEEPEAEPEEIELDTFEPNTSEEEPVEPDEADVTSIKLMDRRIVDFREWQRDQSEPIKSLGVVEAGDQAGALVDRETNEIVGAVQGTAFAETYQAAIDAAVEKAESTGRPAVMPENYVGVIGPDSASSAEGGGQDGAEGDAGFEGEEGAVTGEQRVEIPSIVEEIYRSVNGLGTNETRLIYALKRIESTSHLNAVMQMYRETYNQSMPQDIIDDFKFQGGNTDKVIKEINKVMMSLGAQLVGSQWWDLKWETFNPSEWSDVEKLYDYPITEYIAAREKYYQNLTREEELFFDADGNKRNDLSDREQRELDALEAERNELLDKYSRVILRHGRESISVEPVGADQ